MRGAAVGRAVAHGTLWAAQRDGTHKSAVTCVARSVHSSVCETRGNSALAAPFDREPTRSTLAVGPSRQCTDSTSLRPRRRYADLGA
jgi:hypothetical protein